MPGPSRKRRHVPLFDDGAVEPPPPAPVRVPVLLPYPFAGPFDYRVPPGLQVAPGDLVLVPLNRREEIGVVWDGPPDAAVGDNRLRPISGRLDGPPMRADLRRLIDWIAAYTLAPPGEVLAMALRVNALRAEPPATGWRLADPLPETRLTDARKNVLAALADGQPRTGAELARAAEVSPGVLRSMAEAGLLLPAALPVRPPFDRPDPAHPGPTLSPDQEQAAAALRAAAGSHAFSVTLLDGVTGSGNRSLYGGHRGVPGRRPAGAGAAARNRAVRPVAGPLRPSLRRGAGGLAL